MHIGLIGGIGPAATVAYYTRLVAAFKAANLPLELTIAHADVSLLAQNAGANDKAAQSKIFATHLRQLAGAGCDIGMITALTGHFCYAETAQHSPIPLINGIDVIDSYCAQQGIQMLGVLGSPPVLKTKLFGLLKASKIVVPQTDLETLGASYMEMAQSGICTETNRALFFKAGAAMVQDQKAEAVLLAGTELGLAFDGYQPGFKVIDALELHVQALVAMAAQA